MNAFRLSSCAALCLLTAACGTWSVEKDVDALRVTEPQGPAFTKALAQGYRRFAIFESDQMYDWPSADHFARKGLRAARGDIVSPEDLRNWRIPAAYVDEIKHARARLMAAIDSGGWIRAPEEAARAQTSFDCWVEQQEENWQWDDIAACRDAFYLNVDRTEAAVAKARKAAESARNGGTAAGYPATGMWRSSSR